jgi:hypothetical protein
LALEAATRIDIGPFAAWNVPACLYPNLERGFRGDAPDKPWNFFQLLNRMYALAPARSWPLEF